MTYPKTFVAANFTLLSDGQYMATIPESVHQLGTNYRVTKNLRRDNDRNWQNMLPTYKILANGDFELYVAEPGIYKILLVGD